MIKNIVLIIVVLLFRSLALAGQHLEPLSYYNVYSGTSDFSTARLFCLGEAHNYSTDLRAATYLLTKYVSTPQDDFDIVFFEGDSSETLNGLVTSYNGEVLPSTVRVMGWDSVFGFAFQKALTEDLVRYHDTIISEDATYRQKAKALWFGLTHRIFIADTKDGRDNTMVDNVRKAMQEHPKSKIFIIAGIDHCADNDILDYAQSINTPYSILIPKEDNPNRKASMSEMDYVRKLED